jgi:hypothetical protein
VVELLDGEGDLDGRHVVGPEDDHGLGPADPGPDQLRLPDPDDGEQLGVELRQLLQRARVGVATGQHGDPLPGAGELLDDPDGRRLAADDEHPVTDRRPARHRVGHGRHRREVVG